MITTASADALARLLDEEHYELSRRVPPAGDEHRNRGADDDPTEGDPPARVPGRAIAHGIRSAPSTPPLIGGRPDRAGEPVRRGGERVRRGIQPPRQHNSPSWRRPTVTAALRHYDEAGLDRPPAHRAVVPVGDRQSIGIGILHCRHEAAFDVLRTGSQNRNIPLRQVAPTWSTNDRPPPPTPQVQPSTCAAGVNVQGSPPERTSPGVEPEGPGCRD